MSKWLTIEERANAKTEKAENKAKIKALRREIYKLQQRNKRLTNAINNKTYKAYRENGVVKKMFGKGFNELTEKEKREYNRVMKEKYDNASQTKCWVSQRNVKAFTLLVQWWENLKQSPLPVTRVGVSVIIKFNKHNNKREINDIPIFVVNEKGFFMEKDEKFTT